MNEERLNQLIDAYLFGAPSPDEAAELERAIRANPTELRDLYWKRVRFHTLMREFCEPRPMARLAAEIAQSGGEFPQKPAHEMKAEQQASDGGQSSARTPVLGFLGGVIDYASHSRMFMLWLIAGLLGLYFVFQLGSLMISRFWAQNAAPLAQNGGAGTEKHGPAGEQPDAPAGKVVAHLTDAVDCRWELSRADGTNRIDQPESVVLEIGTEFHAGQKLTLAAGLAELTFDSGAKVILHAPVRFNVADSMGGHLQIGKLTAKVPHTAAGFTIATPGGKVVDLGTEFGVKVNDDGKMNVIVYVGDVNVQSGSGDGAGAGGGDQAKVVHLHAGQAVTIGSDHVAKPIPPENERFVRDLAPLGDKAKAEAAYVDFVKSLKPVVWFRMEGKETERVLHDEMGGQDANLVWDGPGNPFVKGRVGQGLWLRGTKLKDCAVLPDYPKADHERLSVSAWVYLESRPRAATILANWPLLGNKGGGVSSGQFIFNLSNASVNLVASITERGGKTVYADEPATQPVPLDQWQHVAFTTDGATLRLYRQGHEVGRAKHNGLLSVSPVKGLGIGARVPGSGIEAKGEPCWWDGKLDEIAVFNDALSAEAIGKLANFVPR